MYEEFFQKTVIELIHLKFLEFVACIFWGVLLYLFLTFFFYERKQNLQLQRTVKKRNFTYILYILCGGTFITHRSSHWLNWHINYPIFANDFTTAFFIGLSCMIGGLSIVTAGRIALGVYWGKDIYKYKQEDNRLIDKGIYKNYRHPIYNGQIVMAIGTFFLFNNWLLILFPLCILIVNYYRARNEEIDLFERFGNVFKDYKNATFGYWVITS